ncbi:MAG: hypothetical protein ACREE7_07880 [Dongiaceae bacterium]
MAEARRASSSIRLPFALALTLLIPGALTPDPALARDCGPSTVRDAASDGCTAQPGENPGLNIDGDSGSETDRQDKGDKNSTNGGPSASS